MSNNKSNAARLAAELRPTMPADVLRLWADDAAAELRRLNAVNRELLEALKEITTQHGQWNNGMWAAGVARAAIAKATDV